jgi:hypothetical protein
MQSGIAVHNTDQKQGNAMNNNPNAPTKDRSALKHFPLILTWRTAGDHAAGQEQGPRNKDRHYDGIGPTALILIYANHLGLAGPGWYGAGPLAL